MAKVTGAKQNFTAGELSPRLAGRTDLGRYPDGVLHRRIRHRHR